MAQASNKNRMSMWLRGAPVVSAVMPVFAAFTGISIAQTFLVTSIAFAGLSLWGYTTKKDISGWGAFLMMGLIGLIVASIINIFLGSPAGCPDPLCKAVLAEVKAVKATYSSRVNFLHVETRDPADVTRRSTAADAWAGGSLGG